MDCTVPSPLAAPRVRPCAIWPSRLHCAGACSVSSAVRVPASRVRSKVRGSLRRRGDAQQLITNGFARRSRLTRCGDGPTTGLVSVQETSLTGERTDVHLFQDWCWLGTADDASSLHALLDAPPRAALSTSTSIAFFASGFHGSGAHLPARSVAGALTPPYSRNGLSCSGAALEIPGLCRELLSPLLPNPNCRGSWA